MKEEPFLSFVLVNNLKWGIEVLFFSLSFSLSGLMSL